MLKSLYLYAKYFSFSLFSGNARAIILNDLNRYYNKNSILKNIPIVSENEKQLAIKRAVDWLLFSQKQMKDNGIGSYHLVNGWSASYPETTAYIIPALIKFAEKNNNEKIIKAALSAADWLVEIQKESGGWQGGRIDDNRTETVFNTGQIIRGLISAFEYTKNDKYLNSSIKAADRLCEIQNEKGYWKKYASMNRARVYDSYVDFPLLMVFQITGNKKYKEHAIKNLNWIIDKKQNKNGWFEDCDNTIKHNDKPILHTIAYTIDGLLDCGISLKNEKYIYAAIRPANVLLKKFEENNFLHGRFDKNWNGSEYLITTGCAQIAIVWLKLFMQYADKKYLISAKKMNDLLVCIQNRNIKESNNTFGAITGSFPLWGKYEPFAFPNWAVKYCIDSLMMEREVRKGSIRTPYSREAEA
ncbi:MAG: terpene cyclase/mutase family protein [Bacteroidales bacterium]|nr:terpene cyclase/mutase family protein [Bacteroidales bacterium]